MIKTTLLIEGMKCPMCEAHINDVIRRNFDIKKVSSSHSKGKTVMISEYYPDFALLKKYIERSGYTLVSIKSETYEKKIRTLFK